MLHQILLITFFNSFGDHAAADKATVNEIDLKITVGTYQYRFAQIPFYLNAIFFHLDRYQLCSDLSAVDPVDDFPQVTVS